MVIICPVDVDGILFSEFYDPHSSCDDPLAASLWNFEIRKTFGTPKIPAAKTVMCTL